MTVQAESFHLNGHIISSRDSKVRVILQNSTQHSGIERVNGNTSRISSAWWKVRTSVCCVINRVIGKCLFSRLRYGFVCILLKVGEHQTVLITEDSKDGAHFVGHNKYYDQVSDWNQCASVLPSFLLFFNLKFCRLKDSHILAIVNNANPLKRKAWRKCETESGTRENHAPYGACKFLENPRKRGFGAAVLISKLTIQKCKPTQLY